MRRMDDFDTENRIVLLRVDINSPIENGVPLNNPRIKKHIETLRELRDAKVILLAHQGRRGDEDCISLETHAKLIEEESGFGIKFINDITKVKERISEMESGGILLLENVRFLEDETTHTFDSQLIKILTPHADYYFLDALSVAHRAHASVIGFCYVLPSGAGKVLDEELNALKKFEHARKLLLVVGGEKTKDSMHLIKHWLEKWGVEHVLIGGKVGCSFIAASKGFEDEATEEAKRLLENYKDHLILPEDVALDMNGKRVEKKVKELITEDVKSIKDIGTLTMEMFGEVIKSSEFILMNGSMGVYEQDMFSSGTRSVLSAMEQSKAFCFVGGGHTISAVEKFKIDEKKLGYVSLSGKALLEYLSGKTLPGLEALEKSEELFFR